MKRHVLLTVITLLTALLTARAVGAPNASARARFDRANEVFQQALTIAKSDKAKSDAMIQESIAQWRSISQESGISNSRIELNIANASMLLGDVGRAVLSYRRAERLAPRDPAVRQGLAAARQRVKTHVQTATRPVLWLTSWRAHVSPGTLLMAAGVLWVAAWSAAAARYAGTPWMRRWMAPMLAGGALLAVTPLAADDVIRASRKEAVVVAPSVIARNGPSDAVYEPTFNEPLTPGVELVVEETRSGWARVALPDGRETWVPLTDIEVI